MAQIKRLPIDEWMSKCRIHAQWNTILLEQKQAILSLATVQANLENIMFSEMSHTEINVNIISLTVRI